MKNLILFLFMVISLSFIACSTDEIKETLSNQVSQSSSKIFIQELQCSNEALVKTDVKAMVDKLFKVEEVSQLKANLVGERLTKKAKIVIDSKVLICRSVTGALLPVVIDLAKAGKLNQWGCTVEKGEVVLMDLIYKGCDKLAKVE